MVRQFWLFKSDPESFGIRDLARAPKKTSSWDGVRNYQARNRLRDEVRVGDGVLIYHSSSEDETGIAGTAVVVSKAYPDHTAFDPKHEHFDPKSRPENPAWYMVDVRFGSVFPRVITRPMLAAHAVLRNMEVLTPGTRLSILRVTPAEWKAVLALARKRNV